MGIGLGVHELAAIASMLVMGLAPWIAVIVVAVLMWRKIGVLETRVAELEARSGQSVIAVSGDG